MSSFTRAPIKNGGFLLGGNAVFTIECSRDFVEDHPDCRSHYTFKIVHKEAKNGWPESDMVFLLTGPDNQSDYTYAGKLDGIRLKITQKSCVGEHSWPKLILERVLVCALTNQLDKIEAAGWRLMHEGRCCVCGRRLTRPDSIEAGIGPECAER